MQRAPSRPEWRGPAEAIDRALAAGDVDSALRVVAGQAERFLDWGPDVPLDRLEAWLDALERHSPDDPWLLYCRAWVWSTKRNHTLALVALRRAAQVFNAVLPPASDERRRAEFALAVAEGTIADREGIYADAGEAFARALEVAELEVPPPLTADEQRWVRHDESGFFDFGLRALHLYRQAGLVLAAARVHHNFGTRLTDRGEPRAARTFLEQARELKSVSGNRLSMANTLNSLGNVERHLGLHDRAKRHLEQAINMADGLRHEWLHSYALNNLAEVHRDTGRFDIARDLYAASMAIKQKTENVFGLAHSYASLADLHIMAAEPLEAAQAAETAVTLRVPSSDRLENARLLSCRARARLAAGTDPEPIAAELELLTAELTVLDAKGELALAGWWRSLALRAAGAGAAAEAAERAASELAASFGLEGFMAPVVRASGRPEQPAVVEAPASTIPVLSANLFGTLRVTVAGRDVEVAGWRSRKAAKLLLILLHGRGRLVSRDEAIELLWPRAEADRAGKHLNVALTAVRRGLEAAHRAGGRCIQRVGESYRLLPEALGELDVAEFERLANEAERNGQAGELNTAVETAAAALALDDRGEYLAELPYEEWVVPERERLRELGLGLRTSAAEWHLALSQPRQAIRRATEVVASERSRESAWSVLIQAHQEAGDRAAALQAFSQCRRALREELGVRPSDRLVELAESLGR